MASYYDVVNQAIDLTVITDEDTGVSYLEPRYRRVLQDNDLHLPGNGLYGDLKDQELWEILKLEVEKRNAQHNVVHALAEWAYAVLSETVNPALAQQEDELMRHILDYMQANEDGKKLVDQIGGGDAGEETAVEETAADETETEETTEE